jgi:molybdopterin/thiamine biosynthesis adenylyltransferase
MSESLIVGDGILAQIRQLSEYVPPPNISEIIKIMEEEMLRITGQPSSESSISDSPLTNEEMAILEQAVEEAHQEIPVNSGSLIVSDTTSRFSSAIWYENIQRKTITLAGIGGIGSYVCFLLARMKPDSIFIYDDDRVEAANMSGQLYGNSDLGLFKVAAIAGMVRNYADYGSVFAISSRFTPSSEASDIMICGFDNMEARRIFFNKWVAHVNAKPDNEKGNCLFIDGRLAAEEFQVLCIKGDDQFNIHRYNVDFLFTDAQADETICSYKQTTFCANMIASYIVNLFVNFCANQCDPLVSRDLPFLTTYNAELMYLKTEA